MFIADQLLFPKPSELFRAINVQLVRRSVGTRFLLANSVLDRFLLDAVADGLRMFGCTFFVVAVSIFFFVLFIVVAEIESVRFALERKGVVSGALLDIFQLQLVMFCAPVFQSAVVLKRLFLHIAEFLLKFHLEQRSKSVPDVPYLQFAPTCFFLKPWISWFFSSSSAFKLSRSSLEFSAAA